MPNTLEWFKERIGKRIFRDDLGCKCGSCGDVVRNGIEVTGDNYEYLHMTSHDLQFDYRDKK